MRIIGGFAAGTIIKAPKGLDVRPTPDLVKQAIFNSLGDRPEGSRTLDLCAGSGALGLESLSRGALEALAIEKSRRHADFIENNMKFVAKCAEKDSGKKISFQVRVQDVFTAIPQLKSEGRQFDLILSDPPFGPKNIGKRSESLTQKLLDLEDLPALLATDGIFVIGHTQRDKIEIPKRWREVKEMRHGDSMMRFLVAD